MRLFIVFFVVLALSFSYLACGGADSYNQNHSNSNSFAYQNNLFTNTTRLAAAVNIPVPGEPSFSWQATGRKHVVCAIFSDRVQVRRNEITNPDKIVWMWHSGLATGREGNILFKHGVAGAESTQSANPLPRGSYFWGVWVFDDSGTPIMSTVENVLEIQ